MRMTTRWMLVVVGAALAGPGLAAPLACSSAHLRLTLAGDGDLNGMSHGGVVLAIDNLGPACSVATLAPVALLDARGRALPARARIAPGTRAGAGLAPRFQLGAGQRATMTLRWIAGPVYPHNRSVRTASVQIRTGGATLTVPLRAQLYGPAGQPVRFERSALRGDEGVAAGR